MNIIVMEPPERLPITLEDVKEHVAIEIDDDDRQLELKIRAVVRSLDPPDGRLGRAMITQTLRYSLPGNPPDRIRLPYPPVQLISEINYFNESDVEMPIDPLIYLLKNDQDPAYLVLKSGKSWPTDFSDNDPFPFKINFVAGFGDRPENVPEDIRLGIMMEVADLYLLRENILVGQTVSENKFTRRIYDNYIWKHLDQGQELGKKCWWHCAGR